MAEGRSPSPPLPPDPSQQPTMPSVRKVQPFQEAYIPQSPSLHVQQEQMGSQAEEYRRPSGGRSRATSRAAPILHQPQPIKEAVNTAFDNSPAVQNQLDPELIRQVTAQVTAEVIRNLQSAKIAANTPTAPVQPQQNQFPSQPTAPAVQPVQHSPTRSSTESFPPRYTPPSPEKTYQRGQEETQPNTRSPELAPSDSGSAYSSESQRSRRSTRSGQTERAAPNDANLGVRRSNTASSRRRDGRPEDERRRHRASGSDFVPRDQSRPYRKDSKESDQEFFDSRSRKPSMRPMRIPSDVVDTEVEEATSVEKAWQPLFDNGAPTGRLGQFLRGLALHLIDDYEPKCSLVVTPSKMLRFFDETKLEDEQYPWETIFGGKMSPTSLSIMYRRLLCQHHLVQLQHHEAPSVPGLTPAGFESFITCLIQAHPDKEHDRLAAAVMNMPISNADNKDERFPKQLPRRLFPPQENMQAEQRLVASLAHESALIPLRGASSMPPPPPASAPPRERERMPYAQTPQASAVVDDEDLAVPPVNLVERERKPYSAREGMGKTYAESERERDREARNASNQLRPDPAPSSNIRSPRSNGGRADAGLVQQRIF